MNWRRFFESASRPASDRALGWALDLALGLLAALLVAVVWPAAAFADGAAVKCAPNEERVWLYDSVTSLNVETKLKCGESVEVIGQQSGYVKVRTANGTEGFLPESNLPKLPVGGDASGAQPIPGAPPTLASVARAAAARRAAAADSSNAAASAAVAPMRANVEVSPGAVNASPAMQAKTVAAVAAAPAQPAAPTGSVKTISNTTTASATTTTSSTVSSTAATPATAVPASAHSSTAAAHAKPKAAAKSTTTTAVTTSAKTPSNPAGSNPAGSANPSAPSAPRTATSAPLHVAAATPAPKAPSAQPAAVVATDVYVGGTNSNAPKAAPNAPKVRTVAETSDDDDDSYLTRPKNESDDPSCQTYFSGYGLSPGQFKWLEENRVKKYPSVCPAASPAMVDYVIIFTHDVDFFNYTMPAPVHYEAGGFSDWTPVLQYDTSVVSHSDIDKSRREYVWVFHVKRGAFDPNKFSPHRRFQYTKSESKYSRTVEDAFEFIGGQGAER